MTDRPGDTIPEAGPTPPGRPGTCLVYVGSPENRFEDAGRTIRLPRSGRVSFRRGQAGSGRLEVISSGAETDVRIPLGWVSALHATLDLADDDDGPIVRIEDRGSRNGTLVAGDRIEVSTELAEGQIFELGRSCWTIRRFPSGVDLGPCGPFESASASHPTVVALHARLYKLAASSVPVMLCGPTGAGKEHLARAIHHASGRPGPVIVAPIGSLSPARLEAELLGTDRRPGLFEAAFGGTLVLDEIESLPEQAQALLLTALSQYGEDGPVRVLSTTLGGLRARVDDGSFRPELYARLAGFVAEVPPLASRREDLGLLCRSLLATVPTASAQFAPPLSTAAFRRILQERWPFNVRQLRQTLTAASLLAPVGGSITSALLDAALEGDAGAPHDPADVYRLRQELRRHLAALGPDRPGIGAAMGSSPSQVEHLLERLALRFEG